MLALSPQFCSLGWLLEDPISHQDQQNINYFSRERTETSDSIDFNSPNYCSSGIQPKDDGEFAGFNGGFRHGDVNKTVKKLNHNASERDRRKRINTLYSTLRSLLPAEDQSRKLSIPATVSRVVKYIPELQREVERLNQKKENLITKMNSTVDGSSLIDQKKHRIKPSQSSSSAVSATQIGEREIVIQTSVPKCAKHSFSETVMSLEEEGFLVVNATSFQSFDGRVFYNFHLQAQGSDQTMDAEMLKKKVWAF